VPLGPKFRISNHKELRTYYIKSFAIIIMNHHTSLSPLLLSALSWPPHPLQRGLPHEASPKSWSFSYSFFNIFFVKMEEKRLGGGQVEGGEKGREVGRGEGNNCFFLWGTIWELGRKGERISGRAKEWAADGKAGKRGTRYLFGGIKMILYLKIY
jgi:hypothetical protein